MQELQSVQGLTTAQAERQRQLHGGNDLSMRRRTGFFHKLLDNLSDPIIKILLIALAINVLFLFRGEGWFETAGIAAAVFAASLISTLSEYSSESAFLRLQAEAAKTTCRVRRDGTLKELPISQLVSGDIVLLSAGEGVPADGVLVQGTVSCDQAALSGESKEASKTAGPPEAPERWDTANPHLLFRGSTVLGGEGTLQVLRAGDRTLLGSMALSLQEEPRESPLKLRLGALAQAVSRLGYVAAALVAGADVFHRLVMENGFMPSLIWANLTDVSTLLELLLHAATLAISVIIVAVPEGLPMMITVVLSRSMVRMQRDQVMVRKLTGIETAGSLNLLFTDKTGTLTRGKLAVEGVLCGDGEIREKGRLPEHLLAPLLESCRLNTGAAFSDKGVSGGNATDRALLSFAGKGACGQRRRYVPFDSAKKFSAAEIEHGYYPCYIKGAPELLLPRCAQYIGDDGTHPLEDRAGLDRLWRRQAAEGVRVVCICAGQSSGGDSRLILLGLALIRDGLRPEAAAAVRRIQQAGIQVVMITGDSPDTARAIASRAGLLRGGGTVLTSAELSSLTDHEIQELLPQLRVVARALPTDKSRLVRVSQQAGLVVGMTGDGINDAPALKLADVGFAMGSGTQVAKEAGDILILDDNIASIGRAILYGRTIFKSIQRFIVFQLTMNLCAVGISLIGPFIGVDTPVTVIQMLWINMIMDTLAGLAFAGEPPQERYLDEAPKKRDAPVLTRDMALQIGGLALYMIALCAAFLTLPPFQGLFGIADGGFFTAFFAMFVFCGVAAGFCARTERMNLLAGLGKNRSFLAIMGMVVLVQLALIYYGGALFRTSGLTPRALLQVLCLSASVIPADLLQKGLFRRRKSAKL